MSILNKRMQRTVLSAVLIGLLLPGIFLFGEFIKPVSAAAPTPKWTRQLGNAGKTFLAPLAADVNRDGRYEIVVVGGSEDYGNDGSVTVLNGATGAIIWQVTPYTSSTAPGIGAHTPFEIADLDLDGIPEIIVAARRGVLVLHGNDGSVYWRNPSALAEENYVAVGDVDGDGHPEVFVCEGYVPTGRVDYMTELSYDGRILRQAWNWHPCWGGLTLGDANHDGIFELYEGDRNVAYSSSADTYRGGGIGLRALDAKTLTPLWNDPTILCSSHAPILADVDKDGIQEVIVADQGNSGIAVLNSADGSVNDNRKANTQSPAHSAPTVYDIDGDGNLEFITARSSTPRIWDLYDWKLDAVLPVTCLEPPKLGNVTGNPDGLLDIIAVTGATQDVFIYHYNKTTQTYQNVVNLTGLLQANAFSLVQDVDNDGLNELVFSGGSGTGTVTCFDTQAQAPTPRARSELQFYGENRCGAAVYVPPLTPSAPVLSDEQPPNRSINQALNPTLSIHAVDFQGPMDITFRSNSSGTWQILAGGVFTNRPNGTYSVVLTGMNSYGTTYYWNVTATQGIYRTSNIYSFTTLSRPPAGSSVLVSSGGNNGTKEDLICSNQSTMDPDGDKVTNIYSWSVNGNSLNDLILPFDTRTSSNPLVNETLFSDGFESSLGNWDGNGGSGWTRVTSQYHSGNYSAYASGPSNLVSDDFDTSSAESITVSFWFRKHGITNSNYVYLRFWNGTTYKYILNVETPLNFVRNAPDDTWLYYSIQTYDPQFLFKNFRIRFDSLPSGIPSGGQLWIDDVSITTPGRAKDYSGHNNYATVHGATWTNQGVVGGAYQFDGKTDYLRIPDNPSLGGNGTRSEISIEFWIKPLIDQKGARIITKQDASESDASYMVGFQTSGTSNTLFWGVTSNFDGDWHEISNPQTVLETGGWQHVVCTYKSGQGLAIYINGTLRATSAVIGNIAAGSVSSIFGQPLFIGYDGGGDKNPSRYLNGVVDEVRIYERALSPMQVSQRYDETRRGLSSNSTISWQETNAADVWRCNVTPNDSFGDGTSQASNTLTVLPSANTPPVAAGLSIGPSPPHGTDSLTATYSYSDANGDPEWGTETRWYKNGLLQPLFNNSLIVPSGFMAKGQVWNFTVRPRDGADFGNLASIIVTIVNSPPSFAALYLTPDPAFSADTLTAKPFGWSDADNDTEGYRYQWQKRQGDGSWQNISGQTSQTLGPSNFKSNDTVRVNCTAFDGEGTGLSFVETKWIANFSLPLVNPLLVASLGTNTTLEDLICYNVTGNQLTNIYAWYTDDVSIANLIMPFDTQSSTIAKDYSPYGNNGAVSGAAWTNQGVVGGAYVFDTNDVITVQDSATLGGDGTWSQISIEFWIKATASQSGSRVVAKKIGNLPSGSRGSYTVEFRGNTALSFGVTISPTPGSNTTTSPRVYDSTKTALVPGNWYHVVCTYQSGPGLTIYINGTKRANVAATGYIHPIGVEPLFIGYDGGSDTERYFNGTLDELRIYPTAITPAEALQRYFEAGDKLVKTSTIVSDQLQPGQQWKCQVTPNTGSGDGTPRFSNTVTIVDDWRKLTVTSAHDSPNPTVGDHLYSSGSSVTCSVTSPVVEGDVTYACTGWTGTGSVQSSGSGLSTTFTITQNSTITWNWKVQYGLLVEVRGSGSTNATGTHMYDAGLTVWVSASPAADWVLSHWLLNGSNVGSTNPYSVLMSENRNLTAVFVPVQYGLLVEVSGSGTTNATGTTMYNAGTSVAVTATPSAGWTLNNWLLNGSDVGLGNPYVVLMDRNRSLTAVFVQLTYTVHLESNSTMNLNLGTITFDGTFYTLPNDTVKVAGLYTVFYSSVSGYTFDHWETTGGINVPNPTVNQTTVNVSSAGTLRAICVSTTPIFRLNVQVTGNGTTNPPEGSYNYAADSNVSVTAFANSGWQFDHWMRNSSNVGSSNPYVVHMNDSYSLTAVFVQINYILTIQVPAHGTTTPIPGNYNYTSGSSASVTAIPDSGWAFSYWLRNDINVGSSNPYNFTMDTNYTLIAVFNATYVLNIQVSVGGSTNPSAGSHNYTEGSNATVNAIASTGWNFSYWLRNGTNFGSSNPINFAMDADYNLTAVFVQQYKLEIQISGSGTTSPSVGSYWYDPSSVVPVSAIPSTGWNFSYWLLDGANVSSSTLYSVTMDANHTLKAVFNASTQYVFADGFESGNFGNWSGTDVSSGETATVVTTTVYGGVYGARFASNGGAGEESAYCYENVNMGEVYVRGYFNISGGLPLVSNGDRFYLLRLVGGTTNLVYAGIRRNGGVDSWVVYVRNGAGWMNYVSNASAPLPVMGSWVCVELHWKSDPTQGLAELYIDGVKIISVTGINTANYSNTTRLDFGMPYSYETNARATNRLTIYGDSAAVSNMGPIGPIPPMNPDWRYLTISVVGTGSTLPAVGNDYPYLYNSPVSVTANPGLGYGFSYWLLNGVNKGPSNPYGFTMDANYTLTAVFVPINYSLNIQVSGQGTTSPSPIDHSYPAGSNVSVTAIPDSDWSLSYWLLNGTNSGSANPYNVTMNANYNLTAVFSNSSGFPGGFEDGFNSWNGTSFSSGETATIVTTPVNDGSNSARFTSNGGAGEESAYCYENVNMGEVYVRGYFYIDGGLPLVSNGDRFYLIRLVGTSANLVYAGIRRNNGVDSWVIYVRNGAGWMNYVSNASAPLPVMGSWVCVELHWKNDPTQGLAELYVNGVRIISVTGINTANYGNAMRVDFGMPYSYEANARATNQLTIYADSAVIDSKYVGL